MKMVRILLCMVAAMTEAKQLHASPSGRLLTAHVCEYLERAQLSHMMTVYLSESNLPKDFWKNELNDFSNKSGDKT